MNFQAILDDIVATVKPQLGAQGQVASYIPALARVSPQQFGVALRTCDGLEAASGDATTPFSIQSMSKLFSLTMAMQHLGDALWQRIGREPSGNPFNSLVQLENENGIPRNPFINAGALVVTDLADSLYGDAKAVLLDFLRQESGTGDRNAALAHFMKSYGNMLNPVDRTLDSYFHSCSITMSCAELARAGLYLANHGLSPVSGEQRLSRSQAKQVNAIMLTCGTYDAAGEFAYRVGLPCKSGVGGGILAVIPGKMSIAVWSPALDSQGNSLVGLEALDRFTTRTGLSIF